MKVEHIVAGRRTGFCGVVDYAGRIVEALRNQDDVEAQIHETDGWTVGELNRILGEVPAAPSSVVHIQYPSIGMGRAPWVAIPPLVCRRARLFITLHEFSAFSRARKAYMLPYAAWAHGLIFVTPQEAEAFRRVYPWAAEKCHVVPIGTNIVPPAAPHPADDGIVHFGQIAPGKGLDAFLDVVEALRRRGCTVRCSVVGSILDESLPIARRTREVAARCGVALELGKEADAVSAILQRHALAVLPFPDGISDKRGSALACLEHGLAVMTIHGDATPEWLRETTLPFVDAETAAARIERFLRDRTLPPQQPASTRRILATALRDRRWPEIARRHVALYRQAA